MGNSLTSALPREKDFVDHLVLFRDVVLHVEYLLIVRSDPVDREERLDQLEAREARSG